MAFTAAAIPDNARAEDMNSRLLSPRSANLTERDASFVENCYSLGRRTLKCWGALYPQVTLGNKWIMFTGRLGLRNPTIPAEAEPNAYIGA